MVFFSDYFQHRQDCKRKQDERAARRAHLATLYAGPLSAAERRLLDAPIQDLVREVQERKLDPVELVRTYGKVAMAAHDKTNCLTEIMLPEAEGWAAHEVNLSGPLAGIPVSLKDTIVVRGFDTSVGYSRNTGDAAAKDGPMAQLLKEAGAVPFVKTALPITLLSFESSNDVWGRCANPHNTAYSPGGSTGGEGALLAYGGSRIGVGSDVAGSVRAPAHYSGCYALRCSTGRWPKLGFKTSMPGQEGVPSVYSPMARTLNDLVYFTRSVVQSKPWRLDYSVHPLDWNGALEVAAREQKRLRVGVLRSDGIVDPSPACARALEEAAAALRKDGHDVFDVANAPSPYEGFQLASILLNADGCRTFRSFFRAGEWNDRGAAQMHFWMRLPWLARKLWCWWTRYVRRDALWAGLLEGFSPKSAFEQWRLVARREAYKARWHEWWRTEAKMDFMLTPPNACPAVLHDGMHDAVSSCSYTFLFNLLDYTAGIVPVTHVNAATDALPPDFSMSALNGVARGAYRDYDAARQHGLPVGVQVVGQRLQEERVLAYMERVEAALERWNGGRYELLRPEVE